MRDRSIEILRFSETSNCAPLSGDLRGTMMLARCCAVPAKIYPTRKNGFALIALFGATLRQCRRPSVRPFSLAAGRRGDGRSLTI
jgi:hypothetical protein